MTTARSQLSSAAGHPRRQLLTQRCRLIGGDRIGGRHLRPGLQWAVTTTTSSDPPPAFSASSAGNLALGPRDGECDGHRVCRPAFMLMTLLPRNAAARVLSVCPPGIAPPRPQRAGPENLAHSYRFLTCSIRFRSLTRVRLCQRAHNPHTESVVSRGLPGRSGSMPPG